MDQLSEAMQNVGTSSSITQKSKVYRKTMKKTRSFTDALREKYCSQEENVGDFIIDIVIRGKPRNNGPSTAELAHLRNIVLSNRRVSTGGLPDTGLVCLCPNVTDLDLSSNLFESWEELLPLLSQMPQLKFLNLSRNHITRHKEELLDWPTPLPRVENLVLNCTGIPLREVLALARLMPSLRELHICCNYYRDLGGVELAIAEGALSKLECLRLNENIITSWCEVWKLRHLPCLTQLILSENPLCDVFYDHNDHWLDTSLSEMDSPDITCHSDGEDSASGSPRSRFLFKKSASSPKCIQKWSFSAPIMETVHDNTETSENIPYQESSIPHGKTNNENQTTENFLYTQHDLVSDLLDDIILHACEHASSTETCQRCRNQVEIGNDQWTEPAKSSIRGSFHSDFTHSGRVQIDNKNFDDDCTDKNDNQPQFYLEQEADNVQDTESVQGRETWQQYFTMRDCRDYENTEAVNNEESSNKVEITGRENETKLAVPFAKLHTLCLSRTSICELDHLQALNNFPQLCSLRIMDIALFSDVAQEDKRKLFVASLPQVALLNGSEVTAAEREKAERHYLRHFLGTDKKLSRYEELENKHGPLTPLFDIDLGARFQKEVSLTFMLNGVKQFNETVSVLQPVGRLRSFIAEKLAIPRMSFRMYHFTCGPYQDPTEKSFDELFLDSLPLSRFDFMDGDELHVELMTEQSASPIIRFAKREIHF